MRKFLKTHGTTLTIVLFLVSTLSGVFLFFHFQSRLFHSMHEWLSMVLLIPVGVHMWRNWPSFTSYFKKKTIYMPLVLSLIASVAFAYPALTSSTSSDPNRSAIMALHNGTIDQVAPLLKVTAGDLKTSLESKGYIISDANQTLAEIAKASGKKMGPSLIIDLTSAK